MNIILISPKGPLYRHRGGSFKKSLRYAPLTLTTLASLVPVNLGANVSIIDEGIREIPNYLDADLIGMTVITGSAKRAYALAKQFRKQGITVVLGGPHVTLLPDEAAEHADAIVVGYAEQTWPQLLQDFHNGELQPRYNQNSDLDLTNMPFPHRHLLPKGSYITQHVFEATRSCKHACDFCVAPIAWGRGPYQKPVGDVVADIKHCKAKKIIFIDLNLISDRAYAMTLFEALIALKIRWFGLSTMLISQDDELLDMACRSGCAGLLIGFESISSNILRASKKGFNKPAQYQEAVRKLHECNISVMGCFVFGLDGDTSEIFKETADFIMDAHIDLPRFAIATPFPATPLYHRLKKEKRILSDDWELYDGQHVVFQPNAMSVKDLQEGHEWAWRYTYRFKSIAKRLAGSRVQPLLGLTSNLGYRYYARNLHKYYTCDWFVGR
ncbi:MAG: radical SAM protein [Mariprofundaceae bacterium]|nr:radical SAM protein [Mariprofundaceae bacterium]